MTNNQILTVFCISAAGLDSVVCIYFPAAYLAYSHAYVRCSHR